MQAKVAIVYNEPVSGRYHDAGEDKAVVGVLDAVNAVKNSLLELQYEVSLMPLALPVEKSNEIINNLKTDIVFNLFEGFPGYPETETWLPEILAKLGILFTGCPADVLSLGLNKAKSKDLLKNAGIKTPAYQLLTPESIEKFRLAFPCIVKPSAEDASHGLTEESVVNDELALEKQVRVVCESYGSPALVEEFISGREFNATVLGNSECTVLPISEIKYLLPLDKPHILTFDAKWEEDSIYYKNTPVVCPAEIDGIEMDHLRDTALKAFRVIGCQGYARVDMRLDKQGNVNVIEINPNPDISPNAGTARQAKAAGMTYTQFIEKIISLKIRIH